jgi:hypothetical protein
VITILRGPAAALDAWCAREAARSQRALPLVGVLVCPAQPTGSAARRAHEGGEQGEPGHHAPASPRSWNGVRNLLAQVAARRGEAAVAAVLGRHRAAAGLVPGCLDGAAPSDPESDRLAARPESHLSHNLLIQRPLFAAWAEILHDLLAGSGLRLLVPDLARLDRESLAALRALYRRFPESAPDLAAGYDPRSETPAADADGLLWENPAEDVWQVILGWRALPGAEAVEVGEDSGPAPDPAGVSRSAGDRGLDSRAFAALASAETEAGAPLAPETTRLAVAGMRAAFRCFGFTAALRLGLALLARRPDLDAEQAAEVHGLIGLAAHNRQFLSRRNRVLADFLERHFRAALEAEARPERRSALCYRLAVTLGRRKGETEAALAWADRAVAAARQAERPLQAAHLEAWAENIRAFALLRADRLAAARTACEAAFARLDGALAGGPEPAATAPDPLVREAAFTRSLLADNLAAVAKLTGDAGLFARWKETADALGHDVPGLERFESITWIELYRERLDLGLALEKALRGLADARAEQDALREYEYLVHAADLCYRRGAAARAHQLFADACDLRRRLGSPRFLRPVDATAAAAAARAGHLAAARRRFAALLEDGEARSAGARAQLLAALADLAAREGKEAEADARMNEAIAAAVDSGERDALLAVALAAGRTCRVLGREDAAREAYERAAEIAETAVPDAPPPPAALRLATCLGLHESGRGDPGLAARCLALLPDALEDADAWWELPRVLAVVSAASAPTPEALAGAGLVEPLSRLRAAAAQRPDCGAALQALGAVLYPRYGRTASAKKR